MFVLATPTTPHEQVPFFKMPDTPPKSNSSVEKRIVSNANESPAKRIKGSPTPPTIEKEKDKRGREKRPAPKPPVEISSDIKTSDQRREIDSAVTTLPVENSSTKLENNPPSDLANLSDNKKQISNGHLTLEKDSSITSEARKEDLSGVSIRSGASEIETYPERIAIGGSDRLLEKSEPFVINSERVTPNGVPTINDPQIIISHEPTKPPHSGSCRGEDVMKHVEVIRDDSKQSDSKSSTEKSKSKRSRQLVKAPALTESVIIVPVPVSLAPPVSIVSVTEEKQDATPTVVTVNRDPDDSATPGRCDQVSVEALAS